MQKTTSSLTLFIVITSFIVADAQLQGELLVQNKMDHLGSLAREPMLIEHPSGSLFVTGYKNESDVPQLWKSVDKGKNWDKVDVGRYEDGAQGNSDVDLHVDDAGNLYLLSMTFTTIPEDLSNFDFSSLKGEQITVGVSTDIGKSWTWHFISQSDYDDRPWITSSSDGSLHIIWNDGNGVHHSVSKDHGVSWERKKDIYPQGGSSFLVSGRSGRLAVRVSPLSASANQYDEGVDLIRYSIDHGETWQSMSPPENNNWERDQAVVPRWVEPIGWDSANKLHILWGKGNKLMLGTTEDLGKTWQKYVIHTGNDPVYYPYLSISDDRLLCTWASGKEDNVRHHASWVEISGNQVNTLKTEALKLDIWSRFDVGPYVRSTGGEYFPIIQLSNGNLAMATTIQNYRNDRLGFTFWELVVQKF